MIPTLAAKPSPPRAGSTCPRRSFHPDAVGAYLRLTRAGILGEDGQVVAQGKDIADLSGRSTGLGRGRCRRTRRRPRAGSCQGLTSWDFGELPPFIARQVSGAEVRTYPALVDRGTSVDLALLGESSGAGGGRDRRKGCAGC